MKWIRNTAFFTYISYFNSIALFKDAPFEVSHNSLRKNHLYVGVFQKSSCMIIWSLGSYTTVKKIGGKREEKSGIRVKREKRENILNPYFVSLFNIIKKLAKNPEEFQNSRISRE